MNLLEIIKEVKKSFLDAGIESAALDAKLLIFEIMKINNEEFYRNSYRTITIEEKNEIDRLVQQRLQGKPVAKILGKKEFYGYAFIVNEFVLDPRPDSEVLIELALENHSTYSSILELGVGSGCLIISLLNELKERGIIANGYAVDKSIEALKTASENAKLHKLKIDFFIGDILGNYFINGPEYTERSSNNEPLETNKYNRKFDLIISNPPYIRKNEILNLSLEVKKYDPYMALDGGEDGLIFYKAIAKKARKFLTKNGQVLLEIGFDQKEEVISIF